MNGEDLAKLCLLSIPAGIVGAYSVGYLPKASIKLAVGTVILLAFVYSTTKGEEASSSIGK